MSAQTIHLPWGKESIDLTLPETWDLLGVMEPASLTGVGDIRTEVERSLSAPIGSPRLSELARPGLKIALVMDDGSRPTPVRQILPAVLDELQRGGAKLEQITLVPAVGLHRGMEAVEVAERTGNALEGLRWENPNCDDPDKLVKLGVTSRGTPVWVDKNVAEADLVVSLGCIEPHIIASFGGGYKNLFPGVAGRETVAHNHGLNCRPDTFNMVGQPIERNPMRLDLEESGAMVKGKVFIVNAVLNSSLQVVKIVSGDPVQAHRAGAQVSASIYGVQVPRLADLVITASCPMDQDLRQGVKALANTIRAVRPGGVVITLVKADEGVGVFGLANRKLPLGRGGLKLVAPLLLPNISKLNFKGMGEEDKFFLYFALQAMRHADLLMYAPTIPIGTRANLPFVTFMDSPQDALAYAIQKLGKRAGVVTFPHGGSTYPILQEN
jgi:nickel-dependent lactate racemase